MYGAKAEAIAKAAWATWGNGKPMSEAVRNSTVSGVFLVNANMDTTATDLQEVAGFPKALGHNEFVKLARELANNPLVA